MKYIAVFAFGRSEPPEPRKKNQGSSPKPEIPRKKNEKDARVRNILFEFGRVFSGFRAKFPDFCFGKYRIFGLWASWTELFLRNFLKIAKFIFSMMSSYVDFIDKLKNFNIYSISIRKNYFNRSISLALPPPRPFSVLFASN